jgi:hypothetical protein
MSPHTCDNNPERVKNCQECKRLREMMSPYDVAQRLGAMMRVNYNEPEPYRTNLMEAAIEKLYGLAWDERRKERNAETPE